MLRPTASPAVYTNRWQQYKSINEKNIYNSYKHAELMREANKIYASIKKDLEKSDDGTIESFSKSYKANPLNDLDDKYYELGKNESLWGLKVKYIREHPDQFTKK